MILLVIIDIAALVGLMCYINHTPPSRRFVELNLESVPWANQTVVIIALGMLFINLFVLGLIAVLGRRS